MKRLIALVLFFSLTAEGLALFSLEKNESEVESLLRDVTKASNEQNIDTLSMTIATEFQLVWVADDGTILSKEIVKREDYLKHIESFWAGVESYTYRNRLISTTITEGGYTVGIITKQSYVYEGNPVVEENYQKVRLVKTNGALKATVIEMHPNQNRL